MDKVLVFEPGFCTGCRQCEIACSYAHEGVYRPAASRVRLVRFEESCASYPVACAYCDDPPCEAACPTGAMTHDPATGFARVLERKCIGCRECVLACPLGAIDLHPDTRIPLRCDLCGGDPACLKACTAGAIRYEPAVATSARLRRARVRARQSAAEGLEALEGA